MKTKNLILLSSLAFLAVGCQEDDIVKVTATPGADVQFGATLEESTATRTIYGDEDTENGVFPIYWQKGDSVIVTSPECSLKQGTYQVPDEAHGLDYADPLNKVGDAGVQWGETNAHFYSIYPASGVKEVGSDYASFTLTMPAIQNNPIVEQVDETNQTSTWEVDTDMDACFMYGMTSGNAEVINGTDVNLQYTPLSTAIRFTLTAPEGIEDLNVQRLILTAPTSVALTGDFTVNLSTGSPVVTPADDASNVLDIIPYYEESSGYLTLAAGESIELNAFIIPQDNVEFSGEDWTVTLVVNGISYAVSVQDYTSTTEGKSAKLEPGQIHRVKLPELDMNATWSAANWMKNIARNVYLSEISIPGSWNSLNSNFQTLSYSEATDNIDAQYNIGVRAFHLDTRWKCSSNPTLVSYVYTDEIGSLGVADGGDTYYVRENWYSSNLDGRVMSTSAPDFSTALGEVASLVKDDEYMVVFVSFAQDSYVPSTNWLETVRDVCANLDHVIDGSTLNENSTVGDVLGKVIVIIHNDDDADGGAAQPVMKPLYVDIAADRTADQFSSSTTDNAVPLYYMIADETESNTNAIITQNTGIEMYRTIAQVTSSGTSGITTDDRGYAPTIAEREERAGYLLNISMTNYQHEDYEHAHWYYLGLGGYYVDDEDASETDGAYALVAGELNPWINTQVTNMADDPDTDAGETSYYPVGIVLMNFVTEDATSYTTGSWYNQSTETVTHNGLTAVTNIYQLNNKFRKAYDSTKESFPSTSTSTDSSVRGATRSLSSAEWTRCD